MIKSSFTKIGLSALKSDTPVLKQMSPLECDLVEEHFDEKGDFIRAIEKKIKLRNQWAHKDALDLFNKLRSHLALICELHQSEPDWDDHLSDLDPEMIAPGLFVKQVLITGGNENLRITLVGFKTLSHENLLDLKSPAVRLDDGTYPFSDQLLQLVSDLESEARQAIYEQKGVGQLNLFDEAPGEAPLSKKDTRKKLKNLADDLLRDMGDGGSIEITSVDKSVVFKNQP